MPHTNERVDCGTQRAIVLKLLLIREGQPTCNQGGHSQLAFMACVAGISPFLIYLTSLYSAMRKQSVTLGKQSTADGTASNKNCIDNALINGLLIP